MPSSSAGDVPPWSGGHAGVGEERHQAVVQAQLAVGDVDQGAVAAVAVEEHEAAGRRHGDAAAEVVEHGEQRRRRQPDRARRPGVLVGLRVRERGSSQTSSSSPTRSTAASATRSATSRSVLNGRCGPCCSMAPSGCTTMLRRPRQRAMSGARRWARWRSAGTRERYRPAKMGRWAGCAGATGSAGVCAPTPTTTRSSSAPATTGSSPPPTSPGPGCARSLLEARPIVGGTAASETFAGATGQHLQLRPPRRSARRRSIDELGLGAPRAALPRHGAGQRRRWPGRAARRGSPLARRRAHARRAGARRTRTRSTATGATSRAARPAVELILAAADRAAVGGRPDPPRAAAPAGRRADRCCAGAGAARPTSMRSLLHARRAASGPALVTGPMVWGI